MEKRVIEKESYNLKATKNKKNEEAEEKLNNPGTNFFILIYMHIYRKRLLTGTLPVNNSLLTGTLPVNNSLLTGTVPANKSLLTGTVPVNKSLLTGTVPVHNSILTGTISVNIRRERSCTVR